MFISFHYDGIQYILHWKENLKNLEPSEDDTAAFFKVAVKFLAPDIQRRHIPP